MLAVVGLDHLEDAHVGKDHDDERNEEGDGRGQKDVNQIFSKGTLPRLGRLLGHVPPVEDGRKGEQRRNDPHAQDEEPTVLVRFAAPQRVLDGPIPIDGYHAQVEDGGRGGQDVDGLPQLAPHVAEDPAVDVGVLDGLARHDDHTHQAVRHGQGDDEVVGGRVELVVLDDGEHDEAVAEEGEDAKHE